MAILIFAIIVLVIVGLLIYGIQHFVPIGYPFNGLICFLLLVVAVVVIAQRSGVL